MTQETDNDQMEAYTEAATSGLYAKQSGLVGKYDNVRRLWEDEITRLFLHPHLAAIDRAKAISHATRADHGFGMRQCRWL